MDREVKEQYQVLIQAKDMGGQLGGLAGTTIVNITLTDVNDNPPRFPKSTSPFSLWKTEDIKTICLENLIFS
jgi:cadherin 15 (M-cadherin)